MPRLLEARACGRHTAISISALRSGVSAPPSRRRRFRCRRARAVPELQTVRATKMVAQLARCQMPTAATLCRRARARWHHRHSGSRRGRPLSIATGVRAAAAAGRARAGRPATSRGHPECSVRARAPVASMRRSTRIPRCSERAGERARTIRLLGVRDSARQVRRIQLSGGGKLQHTKSRNSARKAAIHTARWLAAISSPFVPACTRHVPTACAGPCG